MAYSADYVNLSGDIVDQGEKVVGDNTVQLTATSQKCSRVWIGAPTTNHTAGEVNTSNILIGNNAEGNASGGVTLENDNYQGIWLAVNDPSKIYLTGFAAGDAVEYQLWQ